MAKIGPEIGLLACLDHVNKSSSISSYTAVHSFFFLGLNLDLHTQLLVFLYFLGLY